MYKMSRNVSRWLVGIVGTFVTVPLYSVACSFLSFLMVDYSLARVLLFGFLTRFVRLFATIFRWCFVGDVAVLFLVFPWSPCYTANGHRVFDAVLPNLDVLRDLADDMARAQLS